MTPGINRSVLSINAGSSRLHSRARLSPGSVFRRLWKMCHEKTLVLAVLGGLCWVSLPPLGDSNARGTAGTGPPVPTSPVGLRAGRVLLSPGVRRGLVLSLLCTTCHQGTGGKSLSPALGPPRGAGGLRGARTVARGFPAPPAAVRDSSSLLYGSVAHPASPFPARSPSPRFPAVWHLDTRPALPALRQVSRGPGGLRQVPGGGAQWVRWTWGSCSATR